MQNTTTSSQPTPQELGEAKHLGYTAGRLLLAGGLDPYQHGSRLSLIWNSARLGAAARRLSA